MHLNVKKVNEEIVGGELARWLTHLTPHRAVLARALTGLVVLLFLGKTLCSYIASLPYRRISCWGSHAIVSSNLVAYRAHAFSLSPSFIARKKKPCSFGNAATQATNVEKKYSWWLYIQVQVQVIDVFKYKASYHECHSLIGYATHYLFCEEDLDKVLND